MNRFERMEEFLKCLGDNINAQGRRLSSDEIYSLLIKYDVKEEDLSFEANPYWYDQILEDDHAPYVFDNWNKYFYKKIHFNKT